jgi:hypothetical protein
LCSMSDQLSDHVSEPSSGKISSITTVPSSITGRIGFRAASRAGPLRTDQAGLDDDTAELASYVAGAEVRTGPGGDAYR